MKAVRRPAFLACLALVLAVTAVGCPCVRGPINSSDAIRWWLFATFGANRLCPEMLKRGVPLKVAALGPNSIGRFFPRQCQVDVHNDTRTITLQSSGDGYAYLPLARRTGFTCSLNVELRPDFRLEEDTTYVWGEFSRLLSTPDLRILGVENRLVNLATQTPLGNVATVLGQSLVSSELSRGFTAIRSDDGDDFTLGIVRPPDTIKRPFVASQRHMLSSDTTELHPQTRDYLGPFEVDNPKHKLFVRLRITGAPLHLYLVDRNVGDAWEQSYGRATPLDAPPGPVLLSGTSLSGESTQFANLPKGFYYIVLENPAVAATLPLGIPMPLPLGEALSYVSYSVELGDP